MARKLKSNSASRKRSAPPQATLRKLESDLALMRAQLKKKRVAQKAAQTALRQAETAFWSFMNHNPALVFLQDEEGRFVFCNGRITDVYGDRPEDVVGRTAIEWSPGPTGQLLHEHGRQVLSASAATEHVETIPEKNGTPHDWLMVRFPFRGLAGRALVAAVGVEITAQRRAEASMRHLTGRILSLQDQERRRIARDLHDTAAQTLSALALNLAIVETKAKAAGDSRLSELLAESLDLAEQASKELRDLSHLLHPPDLDRIGLIPAIQWYVSRFSERTGIKVSLNLPSNSKRLSGQAETTLFRVLQESLMNVQRHSGSAVAMVLLQYRDRDALLEIEDQGCGVPPGILAEIERGDGAGIGVLGMRERLRHLGGELRIESAEGRGTSVRAVFPRS